MTRQSISSRGPRAARTYRSALRQQQAEQTRSRVIAAAADLFATNGYAGTTLAKISEVAGVSPETVQGHGPKGALLIAAIEYAAFGVAGEEDIRNLDMGRQLLALNDAGEALDYLVAAQTEVHQRTARLAPALIGGATSDAELDRYLQQLLTGINQQSRRVLSAFRERKWLRTDLPFDEIVETATVICSVENYLRITRDGWSSARYRTWLRRMWAETVFR